MEDREYARKGGRYFAAAAVFGLLGLGTLAMVGNGLAREPVLALVGLPLLPSLAAFALGFWSLARDPLPGLILLEQGLFDNAFLFPAGAVPWEAIAGCTLRIRDIPASGHDRTRPQNRTLLLTLRDPAAFFAALPPLTRLGRTLTLFALRRTIAIPEGFLDVGLEELREAIQDRLDARLPLQ